ncbi:MAG: amidase, partial [Pseudomonadota bacterium]
AALARLEKSNLRLNAFIEHRAEEALAAAEASDARRLAGETRGPLDGTLYAAKDLIDVAGWRTTSGGRFDAERIRRRDAAVIARLRRAGAVLLGKTNLHELAYGVTSENPHFGPVRNPWDLGRSPGGSSGGSAAAVAARIVPMALGTDTGCSIRHPAHCCGVVGFKPSHGRVSAAGVTPLVRQLDHVGPIACSVMDAALALDALAGFDPDDPFAAPYAEPIGAAAAVRAGLRQVERAAPGALRLARLVQDGWEQGDRETQALARAAIETVAARLGAELIELRAPGLTAARRAAARLFAGDPSWRYGAASLSSPALFGADVLEKLRQGLRVGAGALAEAQSETLMFRRRMDALLAESGAAALLAPTCGAPAPLLGPAGRAAADFATLNCTPFNMTGQPSISIPCGRTDAGLPVGLMLSGARSADAALLSLAAQAERVLAAEGFWDGAAPKTEPS